MKYFTIENETNNIMVHASAEEAEALANAERFRSEAQLGKIAAEWPMARLVETWNSLSGVNQVTKFKDRQTAVSRIWKAIQGLGGADAETAFSEESNSAAVGVPEMEAAGETATAELPAAEQQGEEEELTTATDVAPQGAPVAPEEGTLDLTAIPPETPADSPTIDIAKCIDLLGIAASMQHAFWDAARDLAQAIGFDVDWSRDLAETTVDQLIEEHQATQKRKSAARGPRENSKTMQVIAMLKRPEGATLDEIMTAMEWQKHTTRAMLSAGGSLIKKHGLNVTSEMVGEHRRYYIKG